MSTQPTRDSSSSQGDRDSGRQQARQPTQSTNGGRGRGIGRGNLLACLQVKQIETTEDDEAHCSWLELCQRHKTLLANVNELPRRVIRDDVYQAVYAKDIRRLSMLEKYTTTELDRARYTDLFDLLLQVETIHQDVEMRKYDMKNKMINLQRCCIDIPGLSNGQPSLVPGDYVAAYDNDYKTKVILLIKGTWGDSVLLYERRCHTHRNELSKPLNLAFYSSGVQLDMCRNALIKSESPGISEIIWETLDDENLEGRKVFKLDWNREEFEDRFKNFKGDSWIETLFRTPDAHLLTKKVYVVNPSMEPNRRGRSPDFKYDKEFFSLSFHASDKSMRPSNDDRVIIQNPSTFETLVLPFKDRYPFVKIPGDKREEVLKFLTAPNLDFIFVAGSLIESSGLEDLHVLPAQPSLRELFHGSREEVDSMMACDSLKIDSYTTETAQLAARLEKLNEPQRQAVLAILEARYRPKPYILFGPPGTGKTHTLVEAVVQIYKRDSRAKILFCANSNTCADQIYEKLGKTGMIDRNDCERIRAGDSASGKSFRRIIVTTNMKSGGFMSQHQTFDYVILDEAGHAHEPESLVPISSLETSNGLLVLAGDPKQLGPVVMNHQAGNLGLGRSMLERLFKFKAYDKHHPYGRYNQYYITKLLYCYRCDPDILEISNRLFYDNELKYVNKTPGSLLKILNLKKSVQFQHIDGREQQPQWSTSWRNFNEMTTCVDILLRLYKMGLDASQVGIITPYKLQAKEINKALKAALQSNSSFLDKRFPNKTKSTEVAPDSSPTDDLISNLSRLNLDNDSARVGRSNNENSQVVDQTPRDYNCKIDTVDAFQGNEREVIIISTVRTDPNKRLEFLNDARRFNVAVSRAKWLVIVIGHRDILKRGDLWPEYLKHAEKDDLSKWPRPQPNNDDPFKGTRKLFKA